MAPGRFNWPKPIEGLDRHLDEVDKIMRRTTEAEPLGKLAADLINRGGKRLRPALTLTVASLSGKKIPQKATYSAAAVELVHLASLVHDDIMDESPERRGGQSTSMSHGQGTALLLGDFLLARAFALASEADKSFAGLLANTVSAMAGGEALAAASKKDKRPLDEEYFDAISLKTASLFETAALAGAGCAGVPAKNIAGAGQFGKEFGIVFQLIDDVKDSDIDASLKPKVLEEINRRISLAECHLGGITGRAAESLRSLPSVYLNWASPL